MSCLDVIGHFTVVCLVTWPWIRSEAGSDLVLIQTLLLSHVNHAVLMLTSFHLHMKSNEVCIKTRSPSASLPIQGQVTGHTTVKWAIVYSLCKVCNVQQFENFENARKCEIKLLLLLIR